MMKKKNTTTYPSMAQQPLQSIPRRVWIGEIVVLTIRLQFLIISTIIFLISEFVILFDTYLPNMQPVAILSSTIQFLVQKLLQMKEI